MELVIDRERGKEDNIIWSVLVGFIVGTAILQPE